MRADKPANRLDFGGIASSWLATSTSHLLIHSRGSLQILGLAATTHTLSLPPLTALED
jgi:hypothetical protein